MIRRVLITGGAGFIGFHLARHLLAEDPDLHVDLLDNFGRGVRDADLQQLERDPRVRLLHRDLLDPSWTRDLADTYERVFHLAAIIGVSHVAQRPFDVLGHNTLMLLDLIRFCRTLPDLRRLVFASTSEVYAGTLEHFGLPFPTPETTPLALPDLRRPRTSYMLSKIYGEALCHHSGLPYTIVRPHNFYGPRMGLSHVIPQLLERAHKTPPGGDLTVFSPYHQRTFCYIDDAVRAIDLLSRHPDALGEVFNIGTSAPEYTMEEVAHVVDRVVGRGLRIVHGPVTEGSPPRRAPDISKTSRVIGFTPSTPLEEGVRRTWEWYRTRVFAGNGTTAI